MTTITPDQMIADLVDMARTAQIGNAKATGAYLRDAIAAMTEELAAARRVISQQQMEIYAHYETITAA